MVTCTPSAQTQTSQRPATASRFAPDNMYSGEPSDFMNEDLPPTKNGDRTHGRLGLMPGMSQNANLDDQKKVGRRFGVQDGDSAYIKLAKQGGHKDLLWHGQEGAGKEVQSKPAGFFHNAGDDKQKTSLMSGDGRRNPGTPVRRAPPFGSDNMSAWERDDNNYEEKSPPVPHHQGEEAFASQPTSATGNYKRKVYDKKPAPVDMSKLLSFGYVEEKKAGDNNHFMESD